MSRSPRDLPVGGSAEQLANLLGPVVEAAGLDLEDVQLSTAGRRRRVRVVVDKDGGVSLDECADVSRDVSKVLDDADALGDQPYTLEVSSPGVSRPLTQPRHWRRNQGRLVAAMLSDQRQVTGRVRTSDEAGVVLEVGGKDLAVAYADIVKAKVQVEFRKTDDFDSAED